MYSTYAISSLSFKVLLLNVVLAFHFFTVYGQFPKIGTVITQDTISLAVGDTMMVPVQVQNMGIRDLELQLVGLGEQVYFEKPDGVSWEDSLYQDRISPKVWITRDTMRGLFNAFSETEYNASGANGPEGTLWAQGGIEQYRDCILDPECEHGQTFMSWQSAVDHSPPSYVGKDLLLWLVEENQFFSIRFEEWSSGYDGGKGGYAYSRREVHFNVIGNDTTQLVRTSETVILNFQVAGFIAGTFSQGITVKGNDPENPYVSAPFVLESTGGVPQLDLTYNNDPLPDTLDINAFKDDTTRLYVNIANIGSGFLDVSNITIGGGFSVTETTFNIAPLNGEILEITYFEDTAGVYLDSLQITSNDSVSVLTIPIRVTVASPPLLSLSATTISADTINVGDTVTITFDVTNLGFTDLEFGIGGIYFSKADYADYTLSENQDRITDNLWITRAESQGLFNIAVEASYDRDFGREAPAGTEWATIKSADRDEFTDYTTWDAAFPDPSQSIGKTYSMHIIDDDVYYDFTFLSWTCCAGGGGFSYLRTFEDQPSWLSFSNNQGALMQDSLQTVSVTFIGEALGSYSVSLTMKTNDPIQGDVLLDFEMFVEQGPVIGLSENSIVDTVNYGSTIIRQLTINNTGQGALYYEFTGQTISFEKPDYADWTLLINQDQVSDDLAITRADQEGIFNIEQEIAYDKQFWNSPMGTEWAEGSTYQQNLTYDTWRSAVNGNPASAVGKTLSMIDQSTGKAYDIAFTNWTQQGNGGGFGYERTEIITETLGGWRNITNSTGMVTGDSSLIIDIMFNGLDLGTTYYDTLILMSNDTLQASILIPIEIYVDEAIPTQLQVSTLIVSDVIDVGDTTFHVVQVINPGADTIEYGLGTTEFTKSNYGNEVDHISESLWLTRGDTEGLYNAAMENSFDRVYYTSPIGSEWTIGSTEFFKDKGEYLSWNTAAPHPNTMVGIPYSLQDLGTGRYYDLTFTSWTASNGAGFSYIRTEEVFDWIDVEDSIETFTLFPNDTLDVTVAFFGNEVGSYLDSLMLYGNDGVAFPITFDLTVQNPPVLSLPATTITDTVFIGDTLAVSFTIDNTGSTPLQYSFEEEWVGFGKKTADWNDPQNQDMITTSVTLTRHTLGGLFNITQESSYDINFSPIGTEWYNGLTFNATHYSSWINEVANGSVSQMSNAVGNIYSLHILNEDLYYDVIYTGWSRRVDGQVGYVRQLVKRNIMFDNSESGVIAGGGSETVIIQFGGFKSTDTWQDSIRLVTNDPGNPEVYIPIELNIIPPEIDVPSVGYSDSVEYGDSVQVEIIINNIGEANLNYEVTGNNRLFVKENYADWTLPESQDWISSRLILTRQNERGLFNIAREGSFDNQNYRGSPMDTYWAEGRTLDVYEGPYDTWRNIFYIDGSIPNAVGRTFSMREGATERHFDITLLSWTSMGDGGGFAYMRKEVISDNIGYWRTLNQPIGQLAADESDTLTLTLHGVEPGHYVDTLVIASNDPLLPEIYYPLELVVSDTIYIPMTVSDTAFLVSLHQGDTINSILTLTNNSDSTVFYELTGQKIFFEKPDHADWTDPMFQDRISDSVWITRAGSTGLFNIALETDYDRFGSQTPMNTEWLEGYTFDLLGSTYDTWYNAVANGSTPNSVGTVYSMHMPLENRYFDIRMYSWTSGGQGGGFAYYRQEIMNDTIGGWRTISHPQDVVAGAGTRDITIRFIADEPGIYYDTLLLRANIPGQEDLLIPIQMEVISETVNINLTEYSDEVNVGDTVSFTFDISNAGVGTLNYGISQQGIYFERPDHVDWTQPQYQDKLADSVIISRKDTQGLFNFATESGYSSNFSPEGTLWQLGNTVNVMGMDTSYVSWQEAMNSNPSASIGNTYSVKLPTYNRYFDITMHSYSGGGSFGGFAYSRVEYLDSLDRWLSLSQISGSVDTTGTDQITVELIARYDNVFKETLLISSNDPNNPVIEFPIHFVALDGGGSTMGLQIGNESMFAIADMDTVDFGPIDYLNEIQYATIQISNVDSSVLKVTDVFVGGSDYQLDVPVLPIYISPGESIDVGLLFDPDTTGIFEDSITIVSNDQFNATQHIYLKAQGASPPMISLSDSVVSVTGTAGTFINTSLTVYNTGDYEFQYDLAWMFDEIMGDTVYFEKDTLADYTQAVNQDRITANVWITRADQQGLYNAALEDDYSHNRSPVNTQWAPGLTGETEPSRYADWRAAVDSNPPGSVGQTYSMWLTETDRFFNVTFLHWAEGVMGEAVGGGAFSYIRQENIQWLQINQEAITVFGNDSATLEITINATQLPIGNYSGVIAFQSENPDIPDYFIPVEVNLPTAVGFPVIIPEEIQFDLVLLDSVVEQSVSITNIGQDDFSVTNFSLTATELQLIGASDTIVGIGETYEFIIRATSSTPVFVEDTLVFNTSVAEYATVRIPVGANFNDPPKISLSDPKIELLVYPGDSLTKQLGISNLQGADLLWEIPEPDGLQWKIWMNQGNLLNSVPVLNEFSYDDGLEGEIETECCFDGPQGAYFINNELFYEGNFITTGLSTIEPVYYTDGDIGDGSPYFGGGTSYGTFEWPGMFVLAATVDDQIDYFRVDGQHGFAEGMVESSILEFNFNGRPHLGFVKKVYQTGVGSVNQVIILPDNGGGYTHDISLDPMSDMHQVSGIGSDVTQLYYLMFSSAEVYNQGYLTDGEVMNVIQTFIEPFVDLHPDITLSVTRGVVPAGTTQYVDISVNSQGSPEGEFFNELWIVSSDPNKFWSTVAIRYVVSPVTIDMQLDDVVMGAGIDSVQVNLSEVFAELSGDTLTLLTSVEDQTIATSSLDGNSLTIYKEDSLGFTQGTVRAENSGGSKVFADFYIEVLSDTIAQINLATLPLSDDVVGAGSQDNLIYQLEVEVLHTDAPFDGMKLFMDSDSGFVKEDFIADGFELFINSVEDDFATAESRGTSTFDEPIGELPPKSIGWLIGDTLSSGSTSYFYITTDIYDSAQVGHQFRIDKPQLDAFGFIESTLKVDSGLTVGPLMTIVSGDSIPPTVTLSTSADDPTNVSPFEVTIVFSEVVTGFEAGDLTLENATAENLVTGDNVTFTVDIIPLSDGVVNVDLGPAVCTDVAGNENEFASPGISLTYDGTAPVVTMDALSTNDLTPALSGTVDDATAVINLTVDGGGYTATNVGDGTWSLADNVITPSLTDGVYDVIVTATDAVGNVGVDGTSDELTIDNTAPTVTVAALQTNDNTPALSGTVDDVTATISLTVAGEVYAPTNAGDGTWSLADNVITPVLGDGIYDVGVTATDGIGNVGTDGTTDELLIDTTAPTVTVNQKVTADPTPSLSGTVDDTGATVTVNVGGQEVSATVTDNTWAVGDNVLEPLSDDTYDVMATATDALGNVGVDGTTDELIVNTTNPIITVDFLTTNDRTPPLSGLISDPDASIEITVDGDSYTATNVGDGTWTLSDNMISPQLEERSYDVVALATAVSTATGTDNTTLELTIDITAPQVTIEKKETFDVTPSLSGTVSDPAAAVRVSVDGETYTATTDGTDWTLADNLIQPLAVGLYSVTVTATDVAGNVGTDPSSAELRILPSPVTALEPTELGNFSFTAQWEAVASGEEVTYSFDVSAKPYFSSFVAGYEKVLTSETNREVTGLIYGRVYYYRVRVRYPSGDFSEYSNVIQVKTLVDPNTVSDSLAMLAIYQATGGEDWLNKTNYDVPNNKDLRLKDMFGVTMSGTRITAIDLSNNNLQGALPDLTDGLENVTTVDLSGNAINDIGLLTGLTSLTSLDVRNNKLEFGELEELEAASVPAQYDPQGKVLEVLPTLQQIGESYVVNREVSGTGNTYAWKRDGTDIAEEGSSLTVEINTFDDEGVYHALVTNGAFPGLTLETEPVILKISSLKRDSTALVNIYTALDGENWTNSPNWLVGNLSQWNGVTINNQRVTDINLTNRNVRGEVPIDMTDIRGLETVNLSNNDVFSIPDMSALTDLTSLNVSGNALDFDDLLPNAGITGINYANQDEIGEETYGEFDKGTTVRLRLDTREVTGNQYVWKRNGSAITNSNSRVYDIAHIDYETMGVYTTEVTNPGVPGLTLTSRAQTALAVADIKFSPTYLTIDDEIGILDEGTSYLLKITVSGPYDTLYSIEITEEPIFFERIILGDYLFSIRTDSLILYQTEDGRIDSVRLLPSYYRKVGDEVAGTYLWEEADTLKLRDFIDDSMQMAQRPRPLPVIPDPNTIGLGVETDFQDEATTRGRYEARRRVQRAGCSLSRRRGSGRTEDNHDWELYIYKETDDNGRVQFENLPPNTYRLNIQYPGIPMDSTSFIEFIVGEDGEQETLELEATITEAGIDVALIEKLSIFRGFMRGVTIYPNPANKYLTITYTKLLVDDIHVRLMDLTGSVVMDLEIERGYYKEFELDVSNVRPGIYLLNFYDPDLPINTSGTYKVIVTH